MIVTWSGFERVRILSVALVAVVALCAYTIWQRNRQRKEGWA